MTTRIVLQDAYKTFTYDQDKIRSPDETVKQFKERLKQIRLNILDKTIRIDNGRLDIPVYFSLCGKDALSVIGTKKQMGKGATPQQAEASAVMELAERYSFFSFSKKPKNFIVERYRNIREKAMPFEQIAHSVHDQSDDLDISRKIFENLSMSWAKGYNLSKNEEVLIPFDWFFAINEYNGPSAGNCVEEALSQGICEIVERHVSSLVSRNRMRVPAIRADSVSDPATKEMISKYRNAGIKLYLSDFSLDIGIPTVGVLAYDPSTFPKKSEIVWTAGTTPDPQKALSRALTEVAQLAGDFNSGSNYVASGLPKFKHLEAAEFIMNPDKEIEIGELPNLSDNNIRVEVENMIAALAKKNMEVFVINTTHPMLQIPAFYTIIPGAHFRERAVGMNVGMFSAKLIHQNYEPHQAVVELNAMEKLLPNKYYIKFYLGSVYLLMGDYDTALGYFKNALELNPPSQDLASIYVYMGICLKDTGNYDSALGYLDLAEKIDPDRTDVHNLKGFCYFKLKDHEKAIACFQTVIRLDPGSAIDYANIASNYRDMGNKEQAVAYYQMALALDPTIEFAKINLEKLMYS